MTLKYPTLRECIRKFLYFHKYSYGIVVRRHGILKIRRFQVKSVATLVHRKETQRTNSNRVARKIHSTVITCHDTPFSFFSFFFVCFLIFFIANIVTRRIIGSHFKSSALFRFSLSLSFYLSIPCSLYTFFFSCILSYCFGSTYTRIDTAVSFVRPYIYGYIHARNVKLNRVN